MGSSIKMTEPDNYKKLELCLYHHFIDKLVYLACSNKSDSVFAIGQLSKYKFNLRKDYLQVAKKVVWYLEGII